MKWSWIEIACLCWGGYYWECANFSFLPLTFLRCLAWDVTSKSTPISPARWNLVETSATFSEREFPIPFYLMQEKMGGSCYCLSGSPIAGRNSSSRQIPTGYSRKHQSAGRLKLSFRLQSTAETQGCASCYLPSSRFSLGNSPGISLLRPKLLDFDCLRLDTEFPMEPLSPPLAEESIFSWMGFILIYESSCSSSTRESVYSFD